MKFAVDTAPDAPVVHESLFNKLGFELKPNSRCLIGVGGNPITVIEEAEICIEC